MSCSAALFWCHLLSLLLLVASEVKSENRPLLRAELPSASQIAGDTIEQSTEIGALLQIDDEHVKDARNAEEELLKLARDLLHSFKVGGKMWPKPLRIRDLATHIEDSLDAGADPEEAKHLLLTFFLFQSPSGSIPDWVDSDNGNTGKSTAATDQETSLIQAVHKYINQTGDLDIMKHEVANVAEHKLMTVKRRIELAFSYLLKERLSPEHGLLYGATTVDWGELQPGHDKDLVPNKLSKHSNAAIDIYDNAMMILAMQDYVDLCHRLQDTVCVQKWGDLTTKWKKQARKVLWDSVRQKWRPHVYFRQGSNVTLAKGCKTGSPFPAKFDEDDIYYLGGTAMAMLAGLNSKKESKAAYEQMVHNAKQSNLSSGTIGLTVYPPYPASFFKSDVEKYQGGDCPWWGGRAVQALVSMDLLAEARAALSPMAARTIRDKNFVEWYNRDSEGQGVGSFHTAAGALGKAVRMLHSAEKQAGKSHAA